jgi:hypothetical protein
MGEKQTTIEGRTYTILSLFCRRDAEPRRTLRDLSSAGIQMDRFMMKISIGYPPAGKKKKS